MSMLIPNVRSFSIPTVMKHGFGATALLPEIIKSLGLRRPMIVTDAPSAWAALAVAKPIPELPPNTTTTRPVNAPVMLMPAQIGRDQLRIVHQG